MARFVAPGLRWEKRPSGFKSVVSNGSAEAQGARKIFFQDWRGLDVGQLILRDLKGVRAVGFGFAWRCKRSFWTRRSYRRQPVQAAASNGIATKQIRELDSGCDLRQISGHGRFLEPTAWRNCSRASMLIGESLAISKLVRAIGALCIQEIEQAGGAAAVGVFADVARLFGLVKRSHRDRAEQSDRWCADFRKRRARQ